jgi:hypothetical protein
MASTYLTKTLGTPTNSYKGTISFWYKKSQPVVSGGNQGLFGACNLGVTANTYGFLNQYNDSLYFYDNANSVILNTNRLFRDCNSFYHIVYAWDTTQATSTDRIKLYVNGVQETSFATANYPAQNSSLQISTSGRTFGIGVFSTSTGGFSGFFDGVMSHFNYIDGTAYDASAFGETDATTGEWKIKTSPSVTYGTNGFFILKDGNSVTDQSGEGNDFTVAGGTLTKTEDNPSNVFATLNPLYKSSGTVTFSNGNTKVVGVDFSNQRTGSTLGASSGKFYFETKMTGSVSFGGSTIGIADYDNINIANSTTWFGSDSNYLGFYGGGTLKVLNNGSNNDYGTLNVNDIVGFAFDIDNGFAYISRNGTWLNSGDPTSGSTGTGNVNRSGNLSYNFAGKLMGIAGGFQSTDSPISNFGNGYFGTTAVASAGTNASGIGIFEYDVPTGYTALSTKGLNL